MEDTVSSDTASLAYFAVCHCAAPTTGTGASLDLCQRRARVVRCLETCITQMLRRHETVFTGMMSRLEINRSVNFRLGFNHIADELFREPVSWSKIVTLFAFGARLGQHCRENCQEELLEEIASNLAAFANERISPFVREQGGWVSLESVINNKTTEHLNIAGNSVSSVSPRGGLRGPHLAGAPSCRCQSHRSLPCSGVKKMIK